jgi:thiamine pyrophosphokinase
MIIDTSAAILLVGAGPVAPVILSELATMTGEVVAADGGVNHIVAQGLTPAAIIGDGDSLDEDLREVISPDRFHPVSEQDTTDLEKSLARLRAPLILGLGFLDGRFDHSLAALTALVSFARQPVLLIGGEDACFHIPDDLTLDLPPGRRFSLYPLAALTARSDGLKWPLDGLDLSPLGRIATSNETTGEVRLRPDRSGLIGIIPAADWRAAALALWPAFPGG